MKAVKYVLITILIFMISNVYADIIEETGDTGEAVLEGDIPNRPMRDDANLKTIQTAFDKSDPRANVKRFPYNPDVTYKIRLREFMGSSVVLPPGEKIASYSLFDDHVFTFTPLSDRNPVLTHIFDVYAKYHGADTNLIVHGESGNIYSFYLRNDSVKSAFMPSLVTYIEDSATTKKMKKIDQDIIDKEAEKAEKIEVERLKKERAIEKADNDYLEEIPSNIGIEDINFAYEFKGGNEKIKPIRVYDDGYFTWFQFGEKNLNKVKNLPTIYRVVEGYDTPINTRVSGGSIIAETISDKWTLRSGETTFCIWKKQE